MKEEFLHYVWQFSQFYTEKLQTAQADRLKILKPGKLNENSGPDFLEAHLLINDQKWIGNVEIHLKSSDWYLHNHENDKNYDAVILHVVLEHDVEVFMKNNKPIPTLVLKDIIFKEVLHNYNKLFFDTERWIPCEKDLASVDDFIFKNWLEKLFFERLQEKSQFIKKSLKENKNDFEAALFQLLAKNFGLKVNADAFFNLAKKIDFSIIRKERFASKSLSALLFGVAGFLEEEHEEFYYKELKEEFKHLKYKYNLSALAKQQFQFFRMRPSNFPTIRLAQFIALYVKHQNLFSKLMAANTLTQFYELFDVKVDSFWETHYTFEKVSRKTSKRITKSLVNLVLINTIAPLKFIYNQQKNSFKIDDLSFIMNLPSEENNVINRFFDRGIKAKNAFESQALLQLKNRYCNHFQCLKCEVGNYLLKH